MVSFRLLFILMVCAGACSTKLVAQDFGEEKESGPLDSEPFYPDPYKMSLKIRPLSYFLVVPSLGQAGSFNIALDYAFSRQFAISAGLNTFYFHPNASTGINVETTMLSARLDFNYFFNKNLPPKKYGEGFHLGPYTKFKYASVFDPDVLSALYGVSELNSFSFSLGPLIGYQWVTGKLVIDQSFGIGAGLGVNQIGAFVAPDLRLGLSFGTTLF